MSVKTDCEQQYKIQSVSQSVNQSVSQIKIGIALGENYACAAVLIISADAMMGRWNYIFGHRPTGDVPGIPDGQSAPAYQPMRMNTYYETTKGLYTSNGLQGALKCLIKTQNA